MQRTWKEAGWHLKLASIFALHLSFKVKCSINWYQDVSGCMLSMLKGFCMAKSVQNLDEKIVLSKCEFIGVAVFEST